MIPWIALFAMLDPNRSPIARSGASAAAAVRSVPSSGSDVATATKQRTYKDGAEAGVLRELIPDPGDRGSRGHDDGDRCDQGHHENVP